MMPLPTDTAATPAHAAISRTLVIPVAHRERVTSAFRTLERAAKRVGAPVPTLSWGREARATTLTRAWINRETGARGGVEVDTLVVDAVFTGPTFVQAPGGHRLLARVEIASPENLVHEVPRWGAEAEEVIAGLDDYRAVKASRCDHCHALRRRADVFVVEGTDGSRMVLGRDCLPIYLGVDVAAVLAGLQFLSVVEYGDDDEALAGEMRRPEVVRVENALALSVDAVTEFGFVKTAEAQSGKLCTRDRVTMAIDDHVAPTEEGKARAKVILAWLKGLSDVDVEGQTYLGNLRSIAGMDLCKRGALGLLASAPVAHDRELARRLAREQMVLVPAAFEPGARVEVRVTCRFRKSFDTAFGSTHLHTMLDDEGRPYNWKSSGVALEPDSVYVLRGTVDGVSANDRGQNVTVLSRCSVLASGEEAQAWVPTPSKAKKASKKPVDVSACLKAIEGARRASRATKNPASGGPGLFGLLALRADYVSGEDGDDSFYGDTLWTKATDFFRAEAPGVRVARVQGESAHLRFAALLVESVDAALRVFGEEEDPFATFEEKK